MLIADLIPFIQYAKDSNGNSTGQSFMAYGKVLDLKLEGKTHKRPVSASILQVFDVQTYLDEVHNAINTTYTFAHKIKEFSIEELPSEFLLELKHKKIIK